MEISHHGALRGLPDFSIDVSSHLWSLDSVLPVGSLSLAMPFAPWERQNEPEQAAEQLGRFVAQLDHRSLQLLDAVHVCRAEVVVGAAVPFQGCSLLGGHHQKVVPAVVNWLRDAY